MINVNKLSINKINVMYVQVKGTVSWWYTNMLRKKLMEQLDEKNEKEWQSGFFFRCATPLTD